MPYNERSPALPSLILAAGMVLSALILGLSVKHFKKSDRYVTVKGLVERDVPADLALWPLTLQSGSDDLASGQSELSRQQQALVAFLKKNGFTDSEIEIGTSTASDRTAQPYAEIRPGQKRYILQSQVTLRTHNVQAAAKLGQQMSELIAQGVSLQAEGCMVGPAFMFTKLNELKPDMIAEATKNARAAAQQFAKDSGSSVGGIRQANQGVFSINSRDNAPSENMDARGGCGASDLMKRVRVVTTVDYYLED